MKLRLFTTLTLLLLIMLFAVQNVEVVQIKLLLWQVSLPRSLLIFVVLLVGVTIGWFSRALYRASQRK